MIKEVSQEYANNCAVSPMYWRKGLLVDGKIFRDIMSPLQEQDFKAIDYPLAVRAGRMDPIKGKPPIQRHWRQRSRGYSKTTDAAIDALWLFAFTKNHLEGIVAAEDKEQASLLRDSLVSVLQENPWMNSLVKLQRNKLVNLSNQSTLKFISTDTASSYGERPDFLLCDEFTHWTDEEFWHSLESSYAKRIDAGAILFVNCNAGSGFDWKWEVKQHAMKSPLWYHSAPLGWSPWYSDEMIEEQRALLPPSAFARLFMNEWQDSDGGFITLAEADSCVDPNLVYRHTADSKIAYYIASVDYAEKKDRTVGTVGHVNDGILYIDRQDVVDPKLTESGMIKPSWVSDWMDQIYETFGTGTSSYGDERAVYFVLDPYQLKPIIELKRAKGYWVEEFDFKVGAANYRLSNTLRKYILHQKVKWYSGCGEIYDSNGNQYYSRGNESRDDLCTELSQLFVKEMPSGKWRLQHHKSQHDDRSFGVGLLCDFYSRSMHANV